MAHPRVLKRANGTRQVQISWGKVGGKRKVEYVGSGRTDEEIELLLVEARERINAGQGVLDLAFDGPRRPGEPLEGGRLTDGGPVGLIDDCVRGARVRRGGRR